MIVLDGKESGGQLLRTALAISSLTGQPFRAIHIRGARPTPGLKPQHVHCIKALQELCAARAEGVEVGSEELLYIPGKLSVKNHTIDIGTAGSITLLLQAVLLPCLFGKKTHTLTIKGGTDTKWSMPIDYFINVLVPQLRRLAQIEVKLLKRGYYPKGGGEVQITIKPEVLRNEFDEFVSFQHTLQHKSFSLAEQGELVSIKGISHASKDLAGVAERQARAAETILKQHNVPIDISVQYADTLSTGSGITLWAIYSPTTEDIDVMNPIRIGADALGQRGKPAEIVGEEAANKLMKEMDGKAPVDSHLADNLIPIIGLCRPSSINVTAITEHTRINMKAVEAFLGKIFSEQENVISTSKLPA